MQVLIFNIKNTVIIIVVCEMLKNFIQNESYKKYVSISINLLVVGFLIFQLKASVSDIEPLAEYTFSGIKTEESTNLKDLYELNVTTEIKNQLKKNNILIRNIIIKTDDRYNVVTLKMYIDKTSDYEKVKTIIEELGIKNYEIIKPD